MATKSHLSLNNNPPPPRDLEPWERKVFSDKLKALDRKLGPAMSRISWSNKGIVDFCR